MEPVNLSEIFLDDNYSIESLLRKTLENKINLNELRDRLHQQLSDLNQTSLELFNNSYDRFYKLSYIISCLAEPIQHLTDPIQTFRGQLGNLCQNHDAYISDINSKLNSLEDTNKNKALASKLIQLIKRRDRIESQIEKIDWSIKPIDRNSAHLVTKAQQQALSQNYQIETIDYKIKCDLLERVNVELFHLISEVRAIQPTHAKLNLIKRSLEATLQERQFQLDKWFESTFLRAIEANDKTIIDLIIRTYQQKDAICKLDSVWSNEVVKPYLNLVLVETQLPTQVSQVYDLLDQFVKSKLQLIGADFVARSFWREVVESLDKLEKLYSLNELETFQKRYLETRKFLRKQNQLISRDEDQVQKQPNRLNETEINENVQRIMVKFNVKGYFNHRLSQIASSVESSLVSNPLNEITIPPRAQGDHHPDPCDDYEILSKFKLKICMQIYALVTKCWSQELYIDALELSFSQLSCRIINRFADWLAKLRLSDFRITGPSAAESNKQTNFLAKQDAIMRLLIEDCGRLETFVKDFMSKLPVTNTVRTAIRKELIVDSFNALNNGLTNVRSLRKLIER